MATEAECSPRPAERPAALSAERINSRREGWPCGTGSWPWGCSGGSRADREELASRLDRALSLVADTRSTARGTIVNLPDILFDVIQSTLKPEAKLVIAKLAGILLIMGDLKPASRVTPTPPAATATT